MIFIPGSLFHAIFMNFVKKSLFYDFHDFMLSGTPVIW